MILLPIAFLSGVAAGMVVGWLFGSELGRATGVREERTRAAQEKR